MAGPIITPSGKSFLLGGKPALWASQAAAPVDPPPTPGAPMPTASMAGWWDVSTLAAGQNYNTLTDKSTAGKSASTGGARAVAHMAGMLNGMFLESGPYIAPYQFSELYPVILDYSISANSVTVGAGGAFTVFLVWSRPNQKQVSGARVTTTVPLINVNGATVLSMTGNGDGNDTLLLNGAALGKLELRHTHSARLVFSGTNVDLWLDGVKLGSSTVTQLGATANLSFLSAAHCVFHEASAWSKVLSTQEHADLSGYAQRWPLGPRRAINGVLLGQSNAGYMYAATGHLAIARRIAYLTGCLSSNILGWTGSYGQLDSAHPTIYSGQGLYDTGGTLFLKSSAADPSTWPLGTNGNSFLAALAGMTVDERANLRFVYWFWSESDSLMLTSAMKVTYIAAVKRAIFLIRNQLGLAAAPEKLAIMVISALPFSTDIGCQTHREAMEDLCNTPGLNVHMMLAQAGDATGEGDTWDPTTGVEGGGGNGGHRDMDGQLMYARRGAVPVARAALAANIAAGTPDVLSTIDASIPQVGGPHVLSAHDEGGGSVLVKIQHDGGSDLKVPLRAASGAGWTLNGLSIKATSCAVVDADHLRVMFPSVPAGALLYYGYGSNLDASAYAVIGRGNAVTDNFASVVLPAGWKIGSDLGDPVNEQPNNPLQATAYGIALT